MSAAPSPVSSAYDPELYHRALTGRGGPIRPEEVLDLLESLEGYIVDHQKLEAALAEAENALEEAWIVPKVEPLRPCGICTAGPDRGDGRCEEHGRLIAAAPLASASDSARSGSGNTTAGDPSTRSGCRDEILSASSLGVDRNQKDSFLAKSSRDAAGRKLAALEHGAAALGGRRGEDLDHHAVLGAAFPDPARLEESRVGEYIAHKFFDAAHKRLAVEGRRQVPVASGSAGDPGADVQAEGAARLGVATPRGRGRSTARTRAAKTRHDENVAATRRTLKVRGGRTINKIWLYSSVDRSAGEIVLETSWLPRVAEVTRALEPLGFRRRPDGCYRVELSVTNELGIRRAVGRAFEVMIQEQGRT